MVQLTTTTTTTTTPRKRRLLLPQHSVTQRPRPSAPPFATTEPSNACGQLVTTDSERGKRVLVVQLSVPFSLGRSPHADYLISLPSVSSNHGRIYSFTADTGEVVVCYQDTSTNGTMHNDRTVRRTSVVLSDGDRLEIGGQVLHWRQPLRPDNINRDPCTISKQASIGDYLVFDRLLGSGSFSVVHLALNTKSLKQVACKRIKRNKLSKSCLASVQREVNILKTVSHPNINQVKDVVVSELDVCIFLQLVSGGDLFGYLIQHGVLPAPEAKWILYQLLQALAFLHQTKTIAHRDLKLENVILDGQGPFPKVLLADFGQARLANVEFKSLKGTITYMAPEQLTYWTRQEGYDGRRADCWSLGVILVMLLTGTHPFEEWLSSQPPAEHVSASIFGDTAQEDFERNEKDLRTCHRLVKGQIKLSSSSFGSEDEYAREAIAGLLTHEATTRWTAKDTLDSSWIQSSWEELGSLYSRIVLGRDSS